MIIPDAPIFGVVEMFIFVCFSGLPIFSVFSLSRFLAFLLRRFFARLLFRFFAPSFFRSFAFALLRFPASPLPGPTA